MPTGRTPRACGSPTCRRDRSRTFRCSSPSPRARRAPLRAGPAGPARRRGDPRCARAANADAVDRLMRDAVDVEISEPVVDAAYEMTAGNPLFVRELVHTL